jgi:hypothetical protein
VGSRLGQYEEAGISKGPVFIKIFQQKETDGNEDIFIHYNSDTKPVKWEVKPKAGVATLRKYAAPGPAPAPPPAGTWQYLQQYEDSPSQWMSDDPSLVLKLGVTVKVCEEVQLEVVGQARSKQQERLGIVTLTFQSF